MATLVPAGAGRSGRPRDCQNASCWGLSCVLRLSAAGFDLGEAGLLDMLVLRVNATGERELAIAFKRRRPPV